MLSGQSNKKVLVFSQHFWPEQFRINDIVEYFTESDIDVEVICGIPNYPSGTFFKGYTFFNKKNQTYKNAKIHRSFEIPRGSNSNLRIFMNYISFPLFSLFLILKFWKYKFDAVFVYQTSPVFMAFPGIIFGKLFKVPIVIYVLDLWPENLYSVLPIKSKILRSVLRNISLWHYKKADRLVAVTNKMQSHLIEATGKERKNIEVVPQSAENSYITELNDENLILKFNSSFNVVFTGNISPAQSFETIVEAAIIIKNLGIENVNWIIVGDGMSKQDFIALVNKHGLSDYFFFEGHKPVTEIPNYSSIADVLVGCLVKSELLDATIPSKVYSYIAAGKPIVLAMDGEVGDLINNIIKCGFVSDAGDSEKFALNILHVMNMTEHERKKLGNLAKKYHSNFLQREIVLEKLTQFTLGLHQ